ncbi:MAG: carboxypeptidase-like regulatory domain-containing protein [Terracidiphilus sp.]
MGKFFGWLGGIVAGIAVGYGVWFFTKTPPPPPPPVVTTFEGMVYSGSVPVPKAMVAVDLTGSAGANGPVHDVTDANGAYRFDFTGLPTASGATLSVMATGYQTAQPKPIASPLQTDIHVDFPLMRTAMVGGRAPAAVEPERAPEAVQSEAAHIPKYVRKSAAQAKQVVIPKK